MKLQDVDPSKMTEKEKDDHIMLVAWAWCDAEDKSTEFMFAYMSDLMELDYDEVVDRFIQLTDKQRSEFYAKFPTWYKDLEEMN